MKCTDCKEGEPTQGKVTVTYDEAGKTVLIKEVPALVCPECGAYYLNLDDIDNFGKDDNPKKSPQKTMADFRGIISKERAEEWIDEVNKSKDEWERNL
jgi:YgiT-type zinc finger domain-containing protein